MFTLSDDGGVSDSVLVFGSCENIDCTVSLPKKKAASLGSKDLQSEVIVLAAKNLVERRCPVLGPDCALLGSGRTEKMRRLKSRSDMEVGGYPFLLLRREAPWSSKDKECQSEEQRSCETAQWFSGWKMRAGRLGRDARAAGG